MKQLLINDLHEILYSQLGKMLLNKIYRIDYKNKDN